MWDNRWASTDSLCCFGLGCYDGATYEVLDEDMIGKVLTEDSLKITSNKDKTTVDFDMNLGDLLTNLTPSSEENVAQLLDLKANTKLVKTKDSLVSESVKLNFVFKSQDLKETMNFSVNINTKYSKNNSNILIEEPKV